MTFKWGHGGKSPLNIIETLGHGCAFLDYDQDSLLDILLVGNRRWCLYRNLGEGHFRDVTPESGINVEGDLCGVAVGDYDNDGFPDLYITGYGICALYHNTRNKTFEDVTQKAGLAARHRYDNVTAAAFVDLDSDGRLDLFAGRYIRFTPSTIHFCDYHGVRAGCGVKNYDPDTPRVYRNVGNGAFVDVTQRWGFDSLHGRCLGVGIAPSDSGRGVMLYAANDEMPGDLMLRKGEKYVNSGVSSGTAYNRDGLTQGGMGVDWGDFNNDARSDLIVTTFQNEPKSLYRNDGRMLYSEVGGTQGLSADTTANVGWACKFFDYDNDRWLDLLITNGHSQDNAQAIESNRTYAQQMQLFHNESGQVFRLVGATAGPVFARQFVGRGAAFGDYDNDGRIDAVVVDEEGSVKLLHNELRSSNHWMGVRLKGRLSNRDGIGAQVEVFAGGRKLVRAVQLAGGYLSGHDPRVHFGLGDWKSADRIRIHWPSGGIEEIDSPPVDVYTTVEEGSARIH